MPPFANEGGRYKLVFYGLVTILGIVVFSFLSFLGPWMPSEEVTLRGQAPVTAYKLADDGDDIVFLMDNPRQVKRVSRIQIIGRQFCSGIPRRPRPPDWKEDPAWMERPLLDLSFFLPIAADYPTCPARNP